MKERSSIRKVDELGRVVIPKGIRKALFLNKGDDALIYQQDNKVVIERFTPGCYLCGSDEDIEMYKGLRLCKKCLKHFK